MARNRQLELFDQALLEREADSDLMNQVLEISLETEGDMRVSSSRAASELTDTAPILVVV